MSVTGILGGGPAGLLMALLLARRGERVRVYERRPDPRLATPEAGRSINLALASRGIRALTEAGVMPLLSPLLVPMRGRMIHDDAGHTQFVAYGQDPRESIYSISRTALTRRLVEAAAEEPGITLHFDQRCVGLDAAGEPILRDEATGREYAPPAARWIGADGAGSALRRGLAEEGQLTSREEMLPHDYKEFTLPAQNGRARLELEVLHIWPRGEFMLIALPNADLSFTLTLFMRPDGPEGFAALDSDAAVADFFARVFPDAWSLLPDLEEQFRRHPQSKLGTVYCDPWHFGERMLLIGDAAHAIVPFHGLENHAEMSDSVRDPRFQQQKALALDLERRFPGQFIPRYSMVTFHPEIRYSEALARGRRQQALLERLTDPTLPALAEAEVAEQVRRLQQP